MRRIRRPQPLLPSPWPLPEQVTRNGGVVAWVVPKANGTRKRVDGRAGLSRLIDDFVAIGRPTTPKRQGEAALAFSRRWGPWGQCACGGYHGEIQPQMRPRGAMPRHPDWAPETYDAERIDKLVSSARRLNAWRVLNTKAWADPGSDPEAWAVVRAYEGLASEAEAFAGLGHADPRATIAQWVQSWLRACHVAPLVVDSRHTLEVGGSAGALVVAILDELVAAPRVAICANLVCLTTWTAVRGWDATLVSGRDDQTIGTLSQGSLCPRCREADGKKKSRRAHASVGALRRS